MARRRTTDAPQALVPLALLGLEDEASLKEFARQARAARGDADFELVEASLVFAEVGLVNEASRIVRAACVDAAPPGERGFMPLYYLAWYASLRGDTEGAARWLVEAAQTTKDRVFASRPEDLEVLRYAVKRIPSDAQAHLQLGCLLAFFGRVEEAVVQWRQAGELNPKLSIAWRNLGLAAAAKKEVAQAETYYRKAIEGRPTDQTLYRDLGEILAAAGRGSDVLRLLQSMPPLTPRRGEITLLLARSYCDEHRHDDAIKLLESTPYFVNWEGGSLIWRIFRNAHVERGRQRLDKSDVPGALADFDAALTYPANLNVGRSEEPEEAVAQYWRGKALAALGQTSEAHAAWKAGAAGTVEGVPPNESYNAIFARQQNEYIKKCKDALAEKK
jgi:tetratricopeptide (TPR) repeat protein